MELDIYQIDAFADEIFAGNPAMVVPLQEWLPEELMQSIAAENNLSETAFYLKENKSFYIRWFTPTTEVKLCGHATLATAFVIFKRNEVEGETIYFNCKSGLLKVSRKESSIVLDFPITNSIKIDMPIWVNHLGILPQEAHKCDDDYLFVFKSEDEVTNLAPNFNELGKVNSRGIMCTSLGEEYDFVSRFFAPAAGINEDPVTGSSHTKLVPYWAQVLNRIDLKAKQISLRGGVINCLLKGDRVELSGEAKLFLIGKIYV